MGLGLLVGFLATSCLAFNSTSSPSGPVSDPQTKTLSAQSRYWRCDVTLKAECEPPGGCRPLEPDNWIVLDFVEQRYQRCDSSGCTAYEMQTLEDMFTYIRLKDRHDVFMEIGLANMFVDVATAGISTYNSFGTCRKMPIEGKR